MRGAPGVGGHGTVSLKSIEEVALPWLGEGQSLGMMRKRQAVGDPRPLA